jgi:aspartyl protease family protein
MPNELGPWRRDRPPRVRSRWGFLIWLGILAAIGLGVWQLNRLFPGAQTGGYNEAWTIRTVALLAILSSGVMYTRQFNFGEFTRNVALWLGVVAVLAIGYTFKNSFGDVATRAQSAFIPGYAVSTGPHEVMLSADSGGGYDVIGTVNDRKVRFAVDTGASDIVLTPSDAQRAGIDMTTLSFDRVYETANGAGRGASATVATLAIGPIVLHDVPVSVNQTEMSSSLLGMAFLKRLKSFEFEGDHLMLRY